MQLRPTFKSGNQRGKKERIDGLTGADESREDSEHRSDGQGYRTCKRGVNLRKAMYDRVCYNRVAINVVVTG